MTDQFISIAEVLGTLKVEDISDIEERAEIIQEFLISRLVKASEMLMSDILKTGLQPRRMS